MGHRRRPWWTGGLLLLTSLASPQPAAASGFLLSDHDPAGTARGFARTAGADDAAAVYWNPAAISLQEKTSLRLGVHWIATQTDYDPFPGEGRDEEMRPGNFFVPSTFAALDLSEHVDAHLGVFNPFALATDWPKGWAGRYLADDSELSFIFVQPGLSVKLFEGFALSAGLQLNFSLDEVQPVRLTNALDFRFLGQPDGYAELEAESETLNVGYVVSMIYQVPWLDDRLKIGATWRATPDDHEIEGDATFIAPPQAGLPAETGVSSEVTLPPYLTIGAEVELIEERFWVEVDWRWVGWNTVDTIIFDFDDPSVPDEAEPFRYRNTSMVMVGLEGHPTDWLVLRCGYQFDQTPVPSKTLDPRLPDADRHGLAIGVGFRNEHFRFDIGYMHLFMPRRRKLNDVGADEPGGPATANGHYDNIVDILGVAFEVRF